MYTIEDSYLAGTQEAGEEEDTEKCGFARLFWVFMIGAFLGDVVETVFCRITAGEWMSRSSLVWGDFSIVWGLAMALVTAVFYGQRKKRENYIFWEGVLLGGIYEYICSVFTEKCFGKVFWDYSDMHFQLGGRINLLFCLFWGVAAVVWVKKLYPKLSHLVDVILRKTGRILTGILIVFITLDIGVSALALVRYDARACGKEATHQWEWVMDQYFDDDRMRQIYPNGIQQGEKW